MSATQPPWDNERAAKFLGEFLPYRSMLKSIHGTLRLEAQKHPHEVRAAAALVILLCRENLWPTQLGTEERDQIVHLAARQTARLKQLYEQRAKTKPELQSDPTYRRLLTSLDQEARILESRLSDPKPSMPKEPPCTWGEFWP